MARGKPWHSPEYKAYLKSDEWAQTRRRIFGRRGYRCEACGVRKKLHVHHGTYERLGAELDSDVYVVCFRDHRNIHEAFNAGRFETLDQASRWIIERGQKRQARHERYRKLPLIGWAWR